jgi:hypothetical protein
VVFRYRADPDYTAAEARADAAEDAWNEKVQEVLDPMVDEVMQRVDALADHIDETGQDQPHPWTWDCYLLSIWEDEDQGEDALREELEEHFREEAEEEARDYMEGPCCNDFHCPCGNSNNFRGF